jgi:hypothetical protein
MAFDKAEEAASAEEIRKSIEHVDTEIELLDEEEIEGESNAKVRLTAKKTRLTQRLKDAEEKLKD